MEVGKTQGFPLAGYFMLSYSTVYKLAAYFSGFRLLGSSITHSPTITCLTMDIVNSGVLISTP